MLIDESPLGIVEWNEDMRAVQLNDAAEEILGYSEAELRGEPWTTIVPASDREHVGETISATLADATSRYNVNENVRADGERITCEWHNRVVTDDSGSVVALFSLFQDITDRVRREEAVEQLHETARSLMRAETPEDVATIVVEAVRDILDIPVNSVHLRTSSADRLEPVAWTDEARELVGPLPSFEPGRGLAWRVYESGTIETFDDVSTIEDRYNPETNVQSEIILPLREHGVLLAGSTAAAAFDESDVSLAKTLTATATAALERIERTEALGLERHRLQTLFEMVPEPIVRIRLEDGHPVLEDGNQAFEETFGHSVDEAAGESINDLIVPPDRRSAAEHIDDQVTKDQRIRKEVQRQTADGLGDFLFRSVPVEGFEERDEYFGIYIDISELKTYERRLEQQNERLEMFAGVVSHDLRNPLMVAQSGLEMVRQRLDDGQAIDSSALDIVVRSHERMDQLVDDLLTLARNNEQTLDPEPVSLAEMSRACWETVATDGATVEVETTERIRADESQLKHALENLIRNAVEHGGDDVTVTIGDTPDGFYVEDDGVGIPPDEREQVFEKGYSTTEGGTGFGLVIIQQVADAHGWEVEVTDTADDGVRFEFSGAETGD